MQSPYSVNQPFPVKVTSVGNNNTPNFEFSEGDRPAGSFKVAHYLPIQREHHFTEYLNRLPVEFVVVSAGKVVAFDSEGNLVPAGLALHLAGTATTPPLAYTALDVANGVKNALDQLVTVGELVVASLIAKGITVSEPVGLASYNYFRREKLFHTNWNPQPNVAFVCDYQVEFPLVLSAAYANVRLHGIAACIAGTAGAVPGTAVPPKPGQFVTFNGDSNVTVTATDYTYGGTPPERILGQVMSVIGDAKGINMLDKVLSYDISNGYDPLAKLPGTANGGLPDSVYYSNGYGLVRINLQNR
jgi:hypothetical protein